MTALVVIAAGWLVCSLILIATIFAAPFSPRISHALYGENAESNVVEFSRPEKEQAQDFARAA